MGSLASFPRPQTVVSTRFGVRPLQLSSDCLSGPLLHYLLGASVFSAQEEHLSMLGFRREVDNADLPDHIFYEAHYHALDVLKPLPYLHARYGVESMKPAACRQIRAFCDALSANNGTFIARVLDSLSSVPGDAAAALSAVIISKRMFGGEFMIQIPGSYQLGNCLIFPHTKSAALSPGSACISSAYSIKRGFRYEQYPWRRRVVFINIRMLMTAKEADSIMKSPCFEVAAVVSAISAASEACPLRLPSLEQVLQQEAALRCLLDSSSSGL